MNKNLYVSADSNVKKINFDLRNKVSQRITRNGSVVHIEYRLSKNSSGTKTCLSIGRKAVEFDSNYYYYYYYKKRLAKQGREREIDTLSVRRPQPHTTNLGEKKRKGK